MFGSDLNNCLHTHSTWIIIFCYENCNAVKELQCLKERYYIVENLNQTKKEEVDFQSALQNKSPFTISRG